ncbi:hypothetical protein K504DRAFT_449768 [Pleomassaria siparia CBS 279.74]|uniref:SMP domain-containing protein n=1 Tax=Pleomassaria siparia CBS 279.74 TaxID=1314801 RepID=A0A6G1KJB5_9PLEO|nr:hypothetical protein K504DRAFT_449768 [Pleomassaria siparia CBS 279.74]
MSTKFLRVLRLAAPSRRVFALPASTRLRAFTTTYPAYQVVDSEFLSQITAAEKLLTLKDGPVPGGPTAKAQSHVGQDLTAQVIHDITLGERSITGSNEPVKGGPTSVAQQILTSGSSSTSNTSSGGGSTGAKPSGTLDSETISKITEKEKNITGQENAVKGGPTAKAQQHAGEPITSQALHDITEGEKKITGGERIKGGPTSAAQSALGKSQQ